MLACRLECAAAAAATQQVCSPPLHAACGQHQLLQQGMGRCCPAKASWQVCWPLHALPPSALLHCRRLSSMCGDMEQPFCRLPWRCAWCRRGRSPPRSSRRPCMVAAYTVSNRLPQMMLEQAGGAAVPMDPAIGRAEWRQCPHCLQCTHSSCAPNRSAIPKAVYTRIHEEAGESLGVTTALGGWAEGVAMRSRNGIWHGAAPRHATPRPAWHLVPWHGLCHLISLQRTPCHAGPCHAMRCGAGKQEQEPPQCPTAPPAHP